MYLLQHVYEVTTLTALVGIERYDCRCPLMSSIPTRIFTTLLTPHLTLRNPPFDRTSYRSSLSTFTRPLTQVTRTVVLVNRSSLLPMCYFLGNTVEALQYYTGFAAAIDIFEVPEGRL